MLYSGAYGAAKSVALCSKLVYRARIPGARELLCRVHLAYLKSTTLKTLLFGTSTTPPVLPRWSYTHNKSERVITIHGGGEIVYQPLDDMDKLGSQEFSGVAFDECTDTKDERVWDTLMGRMRRKVEGLPLQIYAACNPDAPTHFLAKRFGIAPGETQRPNTHLITTHSFENPYLPEEYQEILRGLTGVMYRRNVLGQWVAADGLVYGCWDRSKHIVTVDGRKQWKRAWIGIDDGFAVAFAAVLIMEDTDGRCVVVDERYGGGWHENARIEAVKSLEAVANALGVESVKIICDSAAADFIGALRHSGVECDLANKAVEDGIAATRAMFESERLVVETNCVKTIAELEGYCYDPKTNKVVKKHDHACDALRYAIMAMEGVGHVAVFPRKNLPDAPRAPERVCDIRLQVKPGEDLDTALVLGRRDVVSMVPTAGGPVSIYEEPNPMGEYVLGVAAGADRCKTYVVAADAYQRRVAAEMAIGSDEAYRAVAGLAVYFRAKSICVAARHPAGKYLAGRLADYGLPVTDGRGGWVVTESQMNDAILDVRTAWEGRFFDDPSQRARAVALQYRWTSTRAEHMQVSEMPELRAVWADPVLARAALLYVVNQMRPPEPKWEPDPITGQMIPKERADRLRRELKL